MGSPSNLRAVRDLRWTTIGGVTYALHLWQSGRVLVDIGALALSLARYHDGPRMNGILATESLDPYANVPLRGTVQLIASNGSLSQSLPLENYVMVTNDVNELYDAGGLWTRQDRVLVFKEAVFTSHDFGLPMDRLIKGLRLKITAPTAGKLFLDKTVMVHGRIKGDANGNGDVDTLDAFMTAQSSVGLDPQPFFRNAADANCSGTIDSVDALMIAQYTVGLIRSFPCQ